MSQDFTKVNTILITSAHVCYTSTGKVFKGLSFDYDCDKYADDPVLKENIWKDWKEAPIMIRSTYGYYYQGFDIQKETISNHNCLRIHIYRANGNRVSDYKADPKLSCGGGSWRLDVHEIRIFEDASIVRIYKVIYSNRKTPSYYVYNPEYQPEASSRYDRAWFDEDYNSNRNVSMRTKQDANGHPWLIFLTKEQIDSESLRYYAERNSNKNRILFSNDFVGTDLRHRVIVGMNQADRWGNSKYLKFHPDTITILRSFFHLDNQYNTIAMRLYGQYRRSAHKDEIETMDDLLKFTCGRVEFAGSFNEEKHLNRIESYQDRMKSLPFDTEHSRKPVWLRQGDEIICCIYHGPEDHDWHVMSGEKAALFYNFKTKKRVLAISDSTFTNVSLPVPAAREIFRHLNPDPKLDSNYDYTTRKTTYSISHRKYQPKYIQPFEEIFAGTNIEFLRQYADPSQRLFNPDCEEYCSSVYIRKNNNPYGGWRYNNEKALPENYSTVGYQLDPKNLSKFALKVLIGSAEPWLEQSIKCKLFNLYTTALAFPERFIDSKKYEKEKNDHRYSGDIVVNKKASSLKKTFNMTNEQVRILDAFIGEEQQRLEAIALAEYKEKGEEGYVSWCPTDAIPSLAGAELDLGVDLNKIDIQTFKDILELSKGRHWSWNLHQYTYILDVLKNCSVKQRITFMKDVSNDLHQYNDYLRMREQLKNISITLKKPELWDEHIYPVKPNGGCKFFRYRVGQRLGYSHIGCPSDFINHYRYKFHNEYMERYEDEYGNFIGLSINLDKRDVLIYLHDEIQYWVTFYQDESKTELFAKAVERVIPLEYKNEKFGLQIVAPRTVAELKTEGSVLSHCVASFVDPIIGNTENVMFIRKINDPNSPYFTLALDNRGNIEQVHCYHNGALSTEAQLHAYEWSVQCNNELPVYKEPADVVGFLKAWATAMKGKVNKATVKESYGALCARR